MSILEKIRAGAKGRIKRMLAPRSPVVVFHHIPKCGGTSMRLGFRKLFNVHLDYRVGWIIKYPKPANLDRLRSCDCLCGHFELDGYHLEQRYPQVIGNPRFRLVTFLRDPLELRLSLYAYEVQRGQAKPNALKEALLGRLNYIASVLPATEESFQRKLDNYWFIGLAERAQESFDLLTCKLGKPRVLLSRENVSEKSHRIPPESIPSDWVEQFKAASQLDYKIYESAKARFERELAEAGMGPKY